MQGLRGQQHLPAWQGQEQLQGLRGRQHLPAWQIEVPVQGLRQKLTRQQAGLYCRLRSKVMRSARHRFLATYTISRVSRVWLGLSIANGP